MNLLIHKKLFAAWCGLTLSGYNMMDSSDTIVAEVTAALSNFPIAPEARSYFALARTDTVAVNPWYPRGSELSAASLMLEGGWEAYRKFLISCGSPSAASPAFWEWVCLLPEMLARIQALPSFETIWLRYGTLVRERFRNLPPEIEAVQAQLDRYGFGEGLRRICFTPNLLQAKWLADFAVSGDTLYVISGEFSPVAAIHEALHPAVHFHQELLLAAVRQHEFADLVDADKLLALGYMHDRTEQSQIHALEECLVRALTGRICTSLDLTAYSRQNVESGFTSVPEMLERLKSLPRGSIPLDLVIPAIFAKPFTSTMKG